METNCSNERRVFRTECRVMGYKDYLKKIYLYRSWILVILKVVNRSNPI